MKRLGISAIALSIVLIVPSVIFQSLEYFIYGIISLIAGSVLIVVDK